MRRVDRWVGSGLALLGAAVLWSARAFPNVPGQKLGAAFLPMLVGAGLALCGVALAVRAGRARDDTAADTPAPREHYGAAAAVVAAVVAYILLADRLGFLIVAPLVLAGLLMALRATPLQAVLWALAGTVVVHVAFYKLLRVPLPWGVLRPFY